jgi:hypothetical protein
MAKTRKGSPPPDAVDWDGAFDGPDVPDASAAEAMPARAARLPTQDGAAMRAVFAYLLDEDAPEPPLAPPARGRRRKG